MRTRTFAFISLLAILSLMASCTPFALNDALGEWEAASGTIKGVPATNIHLSVMSDGAMYDAGWDTADNHYWFYSDGATAKNVFTGTYSGNDDSGEIAKDQQITITLSLKNGKLSAKFTGAGPLNGVIFTDLTKATL